MTYSLEVVRAGVVYDVSLTDIVLMFFDTVEAELRCACGDFEYFEYEDDEGDRLMVRGDDELNVFAAALRAGEVERIYLIQAASTAHQIHSILPSDLQILEHKPLSRGQFGTVYKALHIPTDMVVAVKCIEACSGSDEADQAMTEIQLLQECSESEFIVNILGTIWDANSLSVCLEFMDRGSAQLYGSFPVTVLEHVTKSIVSGLVYLWGRNIMHRDLKPDNVLINSAGYVKLSDFGVSKLMGQSVARSYVGTGIYMAPERITGGEYRRESDIWSLGLTVWELLLGSFPFVVNFASPVTMMAFHREIPECLNHLKCDDERLTEFINNCLVGAPEHRWNSSKLISCRFLQGDLDRLIIAHFVNSM